MTTTNPRTTNGKGVKRPWREDELDTMPGFDVTCVIGRVVIAGGGPHPPHVAAFMLIAEHDAPGTYTFPMANGNECRVTVVHDDHAQHAA